MTIDLSDFRITPKDTPNNPSESALLGTNGSAFVEKYLGLLDRLEEVLNEVTQPVLKYNFSLLSNTTIINLEVKPLDQNSLILFDRGNYIPRDSYLLTNKTIRLLGQFVPGTDVLEVVILKYV